MLNLKPSKSKLLISIIFGLLFLFLWLLLTTSAADVVSPFYLEYGVYLNCCTSQDAESGSSGVLCDQPLEEHNIEALTTPVQCVEFLQVHKSLELRKKIISILLLMLVALIGFFIPYVLLSISRKSKKNLIK